MARLQEIKIRAFIDADTERIVEIYIKAFAEHPWNETWTRQEVLEDLALAFSKKNPLVLVAQAPSSQLVGFTWGYETPFDEFPFLEGKVRGSSVYMDEIAVDPEFRQKGVGRSLCAGLFAQAVKAGFDEMVLRTDENNTASITLFSSAGFVSLGNIDPNYPTRPYMRRDLQASLRG